MSVLLKEWEAKAELVRSLARSQQAVARILESIADVSARSPELAGTIAANIRSLAALQRALAESSGIIRPRHPRTGKPAQPWLQPDLRRDTHK